MKNPGGVLMMSALGLMVAISNPRRAQTQDGTCVVHPAPASKIITVSVSELRRDEHGDDKDVLIAQAAGFPNDTCDVITTFDVVKTYEERQTWRNVRQKINVVIDGTSYAAKFRDFGFYPLGLNLACIDFESPSVRAQLQLPALPLEHDSADSAPLSYDDTEIRKSDPGTPFLNDRGEISSVLIASPFGPLEFASANDLRNFLKAAAGSSPWPTLRRRSLVSI